jgi:hypothetical protein
MKTSKRAVFFLGIFFLLSFFASAQSLSQTVMIRAFEFADQTAGSKPRMHVHDPFGQVRTVNLSQMLSRNIDDLRSNSETIKKEIDGWITKGFKVASLSTAGDSKAWITTVLLLKE